MVSSAKQASTLKERSKLKYPVVVKALGVAHKTELGLVKININSDADLTDAIKNMQTGSEIFLIEEMITDCVLELSIAIVHDDTGVFRLSIGAGGIFSVVS